MDMNQLFYHHQMALIEKAAVGAMVSAPSISTCPPIMQSGSRLIGLAAA